jgi:hypothetical protein
MSKMFVRYSGNVAAFKAAGLETTYNNSIVFIGDGEAIYAKGKYYGDVKDAVDALELNYEAIQNQLNGLKYFSKISDGVSSASTATAEGTITIKGDDSTVTTSVDTTGIKVSLTDAFKTKVNETLPNSISSVDAKLGEKGAAAASGADATAFGRIKNLETIVAGLTGEEGGEVESVDAKITKAINDLDVDEISGDYIKSVKQVDGKIEATVGTFNFDAAGAAATAKSEVIGASGDASTDDTIFGAKKYAEEKANAAKQGAEATAAADATGKANQALADAKTYVSEEIAKLDANVTSAETGKVKVQVVEVDGKITEVHVTESDIASAEVLAAVKSDVDYFLGSALNKDNAEAVKDTLKEIQDYIDNDVQGAAGMTASIKEAKDAADAAQAAANKAQGEVDALEGVVAGIETVANAAATQEALNAEIDRADKAEKANAAAIKAIADDYLVGQDRTDLEGMINGKVAQTTYNQDKEALQKADSDNLAAAKTYAEGLVNALDVTDAAVAGQYVSAVGQSDGKISVSRANLPTYTLTTGSVNGTVALNGVDASVKGLGSAAYTETTAYATAAQGAKADAAAPQATTYTKEEVNAMFAWEEL